MLRDAGVRTKVLAVLAIPTVLLVVAAALLVGAQVSAARKAGQVDALTDVAVDLNRVVHAVQDERSQTLVHLQDPTGTSGAAMIDSREAVDEGLVDLRATVAAVRTAGMSRDVTEVIARSAAVHDELAKARASIDAERFYSAEADVFYTKVVQTDLQLPGVVARSGTSDLAARLRAHEAISGAIEYAAHERDLVRVAHLRGGVHEADFAQASALAAQQRQALQVFAQVAPHATFARLDGALSDADNFGIDQARRHLVDLLEDGRPDPSGAARWLDAADSRIRPMTSAESIVVLDLAQAAAQTQSDQERQAYLVAAAALLGLVLTVALAIGLATRISRPLRRLTAAAGEIGAELPRMVERMQTPGEGPGVELTPIDVESGDEIGRLAEAFNTVNEVTVRVAGEQAALRASIAETFVNVARRNQLLLGRQLEQIDRMESREQDPDALEDLFKVDHLATRMRRNAESLLVLAGVDSTRRLRGSLPLTDVIRSAVGEIEAFDRVDLSIVEDPEVTGHLALTAAHLLAELLENATHFSDPDTRVVVAAAVTGPGVIVTVSDQGLGMSMHEYAEANSLIADPPVAEIAVSQRLGLFVVGRLAARLGATVTLGPGGTAGTVVAVALPHTVFPGMQPPVVPAAEEGAHDDPEVTDEAAAGSVDEAVAEPADDADVEPVDQPVEAVAEPVDEDVVEPVDEPALAEARRPRRWLRRRRRTEPAAEGQPDAVADEPAPTDEDDSAHVDAPEITLDDEPQDSPEVAPEAMPSEAEPAEAEPAEAELPEPVPVFAPGLTYAAALDVLPGRPMTSRVLTAVAPARRPAPAPAPAAAADGPPLRDEASAQLASDALSELRGLYEPTYAPGAVPAAPAAEGLVRRSRKPTAPEQEPTPVDSAVATVDGTARRPRNATEVRGMLAGFRAGVERGRAGAADDPDDAAKPERRNN